VNALCNLRLSCAFPRECACRRSFCCESSQIDCVYELRLGRDVLGGGERRDPRTGVLSESSESGTVQAFGLALKRCFGLKRMWTMCGASVVTSIKASVRLI
jgi:hypothetical protein